MVLILKIILFFMCIADGFAIWSVFKDFKSTKSQDGYDELSIWQRLKFNLLSFFIILSMSSLMVFLFYFIFSKISIS